MADYTTDIESKSWFRVILRTPTNGAEISKAMICAEREYERRHGHASEWDNAFEVLSSEDEIVIRFEIKGTDAQAKRSGNMRGGINEAGRNTPDAAGLDSEELVEIFTDFIGKWDRSHEVITVGLPDHLPQLRISHLRRAVVAMQRLGRGQDTALKARKATGGE